MERDAHADHAEKVMEYFNSHAHVERDIFKFMQVTYYPDFNSHAHVERDRHRRRNSDNVCYFNSHAHVERD